MINLLTQSRDIPANVDGETPPSTQTLLRHGWRIEPTAPAVAEGYTRVSLRLVEGDGITGAWEVVDRLTAEIAQEQAAARVAAEQARIGGLAQAYGGLVTALSAYLARVGWSIPCEAAVVTEDLLGRDLTGQLTPDQKDAKANVADAYMLLTAAGLSNADITAVWAAVKP